MTKWAISILAPSDISMEQPFVENNKSFPRIKDKKKFVKQKKSRISLYIVKNNINFFTLTYNFIASFARVNKITQ